MCMCECACACVSVCACMCVRVCAEHLTGACALNGPYVSAGSLLSPVQEARSLPVHTVPSQV